MNFAAIEAWDYRRTTQNPLSTYVPHGEHEVYTPSDLKR